MAQEPGDRPESPDHGRYQFLPADQLAAVVTFLEMRQAPADPPRAAPVPGMRVERMPKPGPGWYRDLFRRVGGPWLWSSRLRMNDEELAAILGDPLVEVYALMTADGPNGLLELDRRGADGVQLSFLGVVPGLIGSGAGRYLLDFAIHTAWSYAPTRFWLHTCTLDHPKALSIYRQHGFEPYARAIEIFDDPRLTGIYPPGTAPQIPMLEAQARP